MASAVGTLPQTPLHTGARQSRPLAALDCFFSGVYSNAQLENPDNLPLTVYKRMFETDETVGAVIRFLKLTVVPRIGCYKHPSSRVQTYLDAFWKHCRRSFRKSAEETLQALVYGFSLHERVPKYEDGRLWLADFPALDQVDVKFHMDLDPKSPTYGYVTGVTQDFGFSASRTPMDIANFAHFVHQGANDNPYGLSPCKAVYKHWVIKDVLLQAGAAGMERYGNPLPVGKVEGINNEVQDGKGGKTTNGKALTEAIQNLKALGVLVIDKTWEIDLISPGQSIAEQFKILEDQKNKLIMRGLLVPALLMEPTDIGSFALGQKHFEQFLTGVRDLVAALQEFYHEHVYKPFILANYGAAQADLGYWECQGLEEEDIKLWSEIGYTLEQGGYLRPDVDLDDANLIRSKTGAKPWTKLPPVREKPTSADSGVTNPSPQTPSTPGAPRSSTRTPSKPQGRPSK